MPYLNWKEHSIGHSMHHPKEGDATTYSVSHSVAKMQLDLEAQDLATLIQGLEQVFTSGGELRVDLPDQWIVFWKTRPSETRLLLAHPAQEEWVATAALEETHSQNLVSALKKLSSGEGVSVHELGADLYESGSVNNLELRLTLK
jgi:hypothetical protein